MLLAPAVRGEVVLADQAGGRPALRRSRSSGRGQAEGVAVAQRRGAPRGVADPVLVPAPQRGEPGVERGRHRRRPRAPARRAAAGRPAGAPAVAASAAQRVGGHVHVADLPGGVHPGVGAAGHGQPGRRRAEQAVQRLGRTPATVRRPGWAAQPREVGAVVADVEPQPHRRHDVSPLPAAAGGRPVGAGGGVSWFMACPAVDQASSASASSAVGLPPPRSPSCGRGVGVVVVVGVAGEGGDRVGLGRLAGGRPWPPWPAPASSPPAPRPAR